MNNDTAYIGIDPGQDGGMAVIYQGTLVFLRSKDIEDPAGEDMGSFPFPKLEVWLEQVGGMAGDKPNTAFTLGRSSGLWTGVSLYILQQKPRMVGPQIWQTRFARQFGDRWCPKERKERKTYIHEKIKSVFPNTKILKQLADAAAIAWLGMEGKLEDSE